MSPDGPQTIPSISGDVRMNCYSLTVMSVFPTTLWSCWTVLPQDSFSQNYIAALRFFWYCVYLLRFFCSYFVPLYLFYLLLYVMMLSMKLMPISDELKVDTMWLLNYIWQHELYWYDKIFHISWYNNFTPCTVQTDKCLFIYLHDNVSCSPYLV